MKRTLIIGCTGLVVLGGFLALARSEPEKPTEALHFPSFELGEPIVLEPAGLTHEHIAHLRFLNAEMDIVLNKLTKGLDQ